MTDLLETIAASLILTNGVVLYASVSSRDSLFLGVLISASVAHGFSGTISFCIKFTGSCHINMHIWKAEGSVNQAENPGNLGISNVIGALPCITQVI